MKKIKITFLNPPFLKNFSRAQRSPAVTKSGTLYFPMWLAYATGLAEKEGHSVDLIDAPAEDLSPDDVLRRVSDFGSSLIVADTSTPSIYSDIAFCEKLKERTPDVFILLVGTHVSALPSESLKVSRSVDAVAIGEYDRIVVDIAEAIGDGKDMGWVKGICYRAADDVVFTEKRAFIADLDEVPFVSAVYKKFLNIRHYFNPNALYPMVTITTSRGCPFRCIFCVYPQTLMGRSFRMRSVGNVIEELQYIIENFPEARAVFFEDDTLTINKERCLQLCRTIEAENIRISWTANARVGLDYETMAIMKKAGCRSLCVGFESGNQTILDAIQKNIRIENMFDFMRDAKKAGLLIHGCFMVGFPGETKATMRQTLDLAKRLNPDTVQFYPVMVYPGTEAYTWYKKRGLVLSEDFSKWLTPGGLHNTVIRTEELSPSDLVGFCDYARRTFYLRPRYLLYKSGQMIKHPQEIKRTLKSLKTFSKYLLKGSDIWKQ